MIIKAGTYRFNDVLSVPSGELGTILSFSFSTLLPSGGISLLGNCSKLSVWIDTMTEKLTLNFYVVSTEPDLNSFGIDIPSWISPFEEVWLTESYGEGIKTITITEDTEVYPEFYEWFTANALAHTTISGTWRLKDEPIWGDALTEKVSFISNENNYVAFSFHNGSSFDAIRYYYSSSDYDLAYDHSYDEHVWEAEEYKTISFVGEQEVSQQFYDLFTANATRVDGDSIATITYNGSTIASLSSGSTAILKCKGMTMTDDVVITIIV